MAQKVDFKQRSNEHRCSVCNRPLKVNSVQKKHTKCFVCYQLSKGVTEVRKKTKNGNIKVINLVQKQRQNIRRYGNA